MLVLSRMKGEEIVIGDSIVVSIADIRGNKVRLAIQAPNNVSVHRREVYEAIKRNESLNRPIQPYNPTE